MSSWVSVSLVNLIENYFQNEENNSSSEKIFLRTTSNQCCLSNSKQPVKGIFSLVKEKIFQKTNYEKNFKTISDFSFKNFLAKEKENLFGSSSSKSLMFSNQTSLKSPIQEFSFFSTKHYNYKQKDVFVSSFKINSEDSLKNKFKTLLDKIKRTEIFEKSLFSKTYHLQFKNFSYKNNSLLSTSQFYEKQPDSIQKRYSWSYQKNDSNSESRKDQKSKDDPQNKNNKTKPSSESSHNVFINIFKKGFFKINEHKIKTTVNQEQNISFLEKEIIPKIPPPQTGIFALYYLLTKQGLLSDFAAYTSFKHEVELTHSEIEQNNVDRLNEIKKALNKEKVNKRWGVLGKFFSWVASFIATLTGAILVFSGIGAIVGVVLLTGGLFTLANSIMEWTGSWKFLENKLPGNNIKQKRKLISWIKMGSSIVCLLLSILGIIVGGFSQVLTAAQSISQSITGVLISGFGIASIGEGVTSKQFCDSLSEVKKYEIKIETLSHYRNDLNEKASSDLDDIEQLFEQINYLLELHQEVFLFENMLYH